MSSKTFWSCIQIGLILTLIYFSLFAADQRLDWESVWNYRALFFKGWWMTLILSAISLILSSSIGLIAALAARTHIPIILAFYRGYVEIIRGTPLLVQILFFYYVIAHEIGLENRYIAGVIILSLFNGAYIAEMIRSGMDSISSTQLDSARAIGLSRLQSYRFVIFPETIRQILPSLTGQFASIIKDSSLLSIVGINELTNSAQAINSVTYSTLEVYLPLGIAYLLLTLPISLFSKWLEKRFAYES